MTRSKAREIFEKKCRNGLHPLKVISRVKENVAIRGERVVKWCPVCGSVVIDVESDTHVYPGRIMPMTRPIILEKDPE